MNCMNCEERRQDFLVAIRQRDEARARLGEAVGLLHDALASFGGVVAWSRQHFVPMARAEEVVTRLRAFLASPESAAPPPPVSDAAERIQRIVREDAESAASPFQPPSPENCPACAKVRHKAAKGERYGCAWHPTESAAPAVTAPRMEDARIYPCDDCGLMRSKAEGGTTFTVCDACWEKHFGKPRAAAPAQEVAPPVPPPDSFVATTDCELCKWYIEPFPKMVAMYHAAHPAAPLTDAPALPFGACCEAARRIQDGETTMLFGYECPTHGSTRAPAALPDGMKEPAK